MQTLGYNNQQSVIVSRIILVIMMIVFPISAYISDRVERRPVLICGIILPILLVYPIFICLGSMNFALVIISQILFAGIIAVYMGPIPAVLVEIFSTSIRFIGVALLYNLAAAIFGGTAPMVAILLLKITGANYAISYYLMALALLSSIFLKFYKETYKKNLVN